MGLGIPDVGKITGEFKQHVGEIVEALGEVKEILVEVRDGVKVLGEVRDVLVEIRDDLRTGLGGPLILPPRPEQCAAGGDCQLIRDDDGTVRWPR